MKPQRGFTLLEVMIAIALMTMAFGSIFTVQSSSLGMSTRAKNLVIASMLARQKLIEFEVNHRGKTFGEASNEATGTFEAPYQNFKWTLKVKELNFPDLSSLAGAQNETDDSISSADPESKSPQEMLGKIISNYLSKATREVSVQVDYGTPKKPQKHVISTYWVDFEKPISLQP